MNKLNKGQKKIFIVCLVLLLFVALNTFLSINSIGRADSGWDSSYDSGGWDSGDSSWSSSDWSSSDYDSSSSEDSGWSSTNPELNSRNYHSDGTLDARIVIFAFIFLVLLILVPLFLKDIKKPRYRERSSFIGPDDKYNGKLSKYEEFMANYDNIIKGLDSGKGLDTVEDSEITEMLPDETRESLVNKLYEKFVEVQKAWMDFDYDKLRELCTDELYNTYYSQLEALKVKNGKNIMDNFELIVGDIIGLTKDENLITVTMLLKVRFHDFVINNKTKKVIKGRDDVMMENTYNLVFVKASEEVDDTCPNCGAKLKNTTSGKCEYCGSDIVINPKDFVLTKKNIIS